MDRPGTSQNYSNMVNDMANRSMEMSRGGAASNLNDYNTIQPPSGNPNGYGDLMRIQESDIALNQPHPDLPLRKLNIKKVDDPFEIKKRASPGYGGVRENVLEPAIPSPKSRSISPSGTFLRKEEKGFDDGFATEQERYLKRLNQAAFKQNNAYNRHFNEVTLPKAVNQATQELLHETAIEEQKKRMGQLTK